MRLIPIIDLVEHLVRGETRWTGRLGASSGSGTSVLVLQVAGRLLAVRNRCPHRDVSLLKGRVDAAAATLECPSHGLLLDLDGPDLTARPVVVENGQFYLAQD